MLIDAASTQQDLLLNIISDLDEKNDLLKFKISVLEKQLVDRDKTITDLNKKLSTNSNPPTDKNNVNKKRLLGPIPVIETDDPRTERVAVQRPQSSV